MILDCTTVYRIGMLAWVMHIPFGNTSDSDFVAVPILSTTYLFLLALGCFFCFAFSMEPRVIAIVISPNPRLPLFNVPLVSSVGTNTNTDPQSILSQRDSNTCFPRISSYVPEIATEPGHWPSRYRDIVLSRIFRFVFQDPFGEKQNPSLALGLIHEDDPARQNDWQKLEAEIVSLWLWSCNILDRLFPQQLPPPTPPP
ncbi:hypothetical protein EDD85DRAFT_796895 [Armillaria nabsnona]|nr:hypothetical protein EDD85DRAFT_796895 [Armillaria nabsnona]